MLCDVSLRSPKVIYPRLFAPDYLSSKFVKRSDISSRVTRNSQLLNIPIYRTASGQKSLHYRVVSLWNDLDSNLKLSKSIIDFKREIRKIILSSLYSLIHNFNLFTAYSHSQYIFSFFSDCNLGYNIS
jgi:hypothetical protein